MKEIDEKSFKRTSYIVREEGLRNSKLMFKYPTALEAKLKKMLDDNGVKYTFQKLLYKFVKGYRQYIEAYYIANFWFPKKKLIINVQKTVRPKEIKHEGLRTFSYDDITPRAQVLELREEDIDSPSFAAELLSILK